MSRPIWRTIARAFRQAALPLAWYYAVTLALPLANGAAQAGAPFREHALVVLLLPPLLIVLACTAYEVGRVLEPCMRLGSTMIASACRFTSSPPSGEDRRARRP